MTTFLERHWLFRIFLGTLRTVISFAVWMAILATVAGTAGYFYFAYDLPNIKNLHDYRPSAVSEMYATDGTKVGEFWKDRRLVTSLDQIPDCVKHAFFAAEDANFYEHRGVDPTGIIRALWEDLKAGEFVQGGSTITQQITRALLLNKEKKVGRKVREAILATRLERNLNKDQILTLYLNEIYLGNRSYGVKAAAENYFHKTMDQLNLAECAMIGGMAKAPTEDAPINDPKRAKERQVYVLGRMRLSERHPISQTDYDAAVKEPLTMYVARLDKDFNKRYTPYFTEFVRRKIQKELGDKALYEGGLKIETSVDIEKYKAAEAAVRWGVEALDRRRGWRGPIDKAVTPEKIKAISEETHQIAMDEAGDLMFHIPATASDTYPMSHANPTLATPLDPTRNYKAIVTAANGRALEILVGHNHGTIAPDKAAWAGRPIVVGDVIEARPLEMNGTAYDLVETPEVQSALFSMEVKTGLVRAMIGGYDFRLSEFDRATQATRQPGSSFKPFVYTAALDKGYTYSTPVADAPISINGWSPKNYGNSYSGMGQFMSHITFSRNVPTVRIAYSIGLQYLDGFCRKMGLTSPIDIVPSMALGANGVFVNEMVDAYTAFGNYGKKAPQIFITKITDVDGNVLQEAVLPTDDPPPVVVPENDRLTPSSDLNQELWNNAQNWITHDKLKLDPQEIQVLYGNRIPDGYVLTPQTAFLTVGLLQKVVKEGTGRRLLELGKPVAGKTGTTNGETDTWFIGFTPKLAAGVWVGFDEPRQLGHGEQGGRTAAPVVLKYMQIATKDDPALTFNPPPGFPVGKMASLAGGSAIYWHGGLHDENDLIEENPEAATTRKMHNRAGDYFEKDMGDY